VNRKRLLLAGSGLVLLLVAAALASRGQVAPTPGTAGRAPGSFEVGIPTAQEVRNMLGVYGERVESTERDVSALRAQLQETQRKLDEAAKTHTSSLDRLLKEIQSAPRQEAPPPPPAPRFRTFEFDKRKGRSLHLPAGSFGEATLLTGVYAPISGEPLPVLLKLDAALIGPQRSRVPLRDAFLVGKAQGDANSKRAVVQLELLSAIRPDGTPVEVKTNGWATDDDGIQGLRGDYVWRADEVLALASLTGALSGGAEALAQRETVAQVTPLGGTQSAVTGDPLRFAGFKSMGSAFSRLSDMVSQRLNEIVPAIHVPNARTVTVAFINGVTLDGYEVTGPGAAAFSGLDW
jgi:hypothetical protein